MIDVAALALVAHVAHALAPGLADGADIQGPRPPNEVRAALAGTEPALAACVTGGAGDLYVDVGILAAGFVDRAAVFASSAKNGGVLDERCVVAALRTMTFSDRGLEPPTHAIVHVAARPPGAQVPRPTPQEVALALSRYGDDLDKCVNSARKKDGRAAGSVVVRFAIDNGRGRAAIAGGTLANEAARACIQRELDDVRFDGASGVAVWPLFFEAPPPDPRPRSSWEQPTLFHFLGCGPSFAG